MGEQDNRLSEKLFDINENTYKEVTDENSCFYDDDFSIGIDLSVLENASGNVTPIPTTGELLDLPICDTFDAKTCDVDMVDPRYISLRSLLKISCTSDTEKAPEQSSLSDGHESPRKVHFSDIDQVKLMSHDSLSSLAASEDSQATVVPVTSYREECSNIAEPYMKNLIDTNKDRNSELH